MWWAWCVHQKLYWEDGEHGFTTSCLHFLGLPPEVSIYIGVYRSWRAHTAISCTCEEVQITFIIVCGISCRGDFYVYFDGNNSTSAFQLLQEACFQMCRISHSGMQRKKTSAAKQSEQHLYQRFVYSRFMWGKCEWMNVLSEKQFQYVKIVLDLGKIVDVDPGTKHVWGN